MLLNKTGLRGVPGQSFSEPFANSSEAGERKRKALRFDGRTAMPSPERKKGKKVTYQDYLTWPDEERADANIQGTPDLIVEIASPSTKLMDKRDKKTLC